MSDRQFVELKSDSGAAGSMNEVLDGGQPSIRVCALAKLNLADFQNSVPLIRELVLTNPTAAELSNLTLELVCAPAFVAHRTWRIERVGAGETFHVDALDVQLDGALLSRLTEAEAATLSFELRASDSGDGLLATCSHTLELLARNQWGGIAYLPEMVAAFVQPNDPAVDRILKSAALALQESGQSGAINGYGGGAKRAWELASALWTALLKRKLDYALPPASFEMTGQKVRSPSQVLDSGLATCLDLTLLFAACLEQAGLNALLVFTRGHAFVGLWLRDEEFSFAVVDDASRGELARRAPVMRGWLGVGLSNLSHSRQRLTSSPVHHAKRDHPTCTRVIHVDVG